MTIKMYGSLTTGRSRAFSNVVYETVSIDLSAICSVGSQDPWILCPGVFTLQGGS